MEGRKMTCADLHELVEAVFLSRGYSVITSSRDNRYLLLTKEGVTTAVGYGAADSPPTEGEIEMFVSMAGNDSASRMIFLAPVVPGREARAVLARENVAVWDRMALTLSLGEVALGGAGSKPDRSAVPPPAAVSSTLPPSPRSGKAVVETLDIRSMLSGTVNAPEVGKAAPFETMSEVPGTVKVDLGASLSSMMEMLGDMSSTFIEPSTLSEVAAKAPPIAEQRTIDPWKGFRLAPVKLNGEEACTKAGAQVDPQPELVLVPHLLLDVRYMLRSGQLEPLERTGSFLINMTEKRPYDIPSAISSELCSLPGLREGPPSDQTPVAAGADPDLDGRVILLERLMKDSITQDRLIRDSLMSTIYQEVIYGFDPSTFEVLRTERVLFPYWVKRSPEGAVEWSVDAFLGRFIPGARDH
ncbi:MAG: hypothetical protein MUC62_04965 [Candidatus Thermoplasmatota archaeon]|jgi:hypothetical protein|nr:hypothetical protein [Candidatus Thermoplasmatota archaeon]